MNMPVLVDWLTLVLGPLGLVFLVVAFRAKRAAAKAGEPLAGRGNGAQWAGVACLLTMVVLRLVVGV